MKVLNFKEMESYWGKGNKSKFFVFALLFIMIVTGFYACKKNDTDSLDKNISYKTELKTYHESQDYKNLLTQLPNHYIDRSASKFLESKTFLSHKDDIAKYGTISYGEIKSAVISIENEKITVLSIPVKDGNKTIGTLEVVDLKNTSYLPNGDTYALNYINLTKFNSKTLTGQIQMVDLNFDNFIHSSITVEKNKIKSWKCAGLSEKLSKKYNKYSNPNKKNALAERHLCDGNSNGDVSFSECYKCVAAAIDADGFSSWVCDYPVAGWLSCWGSTTATCLYI